MRGGLVARTIRALSEARVVLGNPIALTPNIDRLPSESLRLTEFRAAPMCTPTRGQLMTGLDAFRNGALVMWRHWRLEEDRWLYDLRSDPHQDHDVAVEHAEVVGRMRAHLDQWWAGVRGQVMPPQRIVIGSPQENPSMLSACDWLDVFIDQQRQIRRGERKSGAWHLVVEQAGDYILELRRWPKESSLALNAGIEATPVTDGTYERGQALPIRTARLKIGDRVMLSKPDPSNQFVRFKVSLSKGPGTLQTWFDEPRVAGPCGLSCDTAWNPQQA